MSSFGHDRERAVKARLEADDWFVIRAAGSLGYVDLVALRAGGPPWMIEVKANEKGGPWMNFRGPERAALKAAAEKAGALAVLAYWPKRGVLRFIDSREWP